MAEKINLLNFDQIAMESFFLEMGEKTFRATQMIKWIHQARFTDFSQMTNLSVKLRQKLIEATEIRPPEVSYHHLSNDGTEKWIMGLDCGDRVETVFIPEENRGTLCISSQIGCALDCRFCSTAQQGFNRNLTTAEIIGQLWLAVKSLQGRGTVTNVVMMGMGEPLLNFDNVVKAVRLMVDDNAYGLAKRRVTISTSGIIPAIQRLKKVTDVSLALSLHAPNDELRSQLVPINAKYPIKPLLDACEEYIEGGNSKRKITIEYVMIEGVNDTPQLARELATLLKDRKVKINLIPFNPFPNNAYKRAKPEAIQRFKAILMKAGFVTTTRKTRGDDIDAACGQLVGRVKDRSRRQYKNNKVAIATSF